VKNFLDSYSHFSGRENWDDSKILFVPAEQEQLAKTAKGWIGRKTGQTVRKTYKIHTHVRDERIKIIQKVSASPALWGIEAQFHYADKLLEFCEDLGAEAIIKKLGLHKSYTKLFEDVVVRSRCDVNSVFIDRLKKWIECGGECSFFAIDAIETTLVVTDFAKLVHAHREMPKLEACELVDILRCCDSLQVSLAEAIKAYRKHCEWFETKQKKTWVFCGVHKITLKKERASLHNFLVDMLDSVEARGDTNELNQAQEIAFSIPDGWEHVATPRKLINISRKNGWCCKLKSYWGRLKDGEMFFFCQEKGLAHYSKEGRLLQAKSQNNAQDLSDVLPNHLKGLRYEKA